MADRAAELAMSHFSGGVVTEMKVDATPVTEADRAVERLLRSGLAELRPGDGVIGEELADEGRARRTWILDPIDGTTAFAAGEPDWRIQIALQDDEEVTVAVVDAPALGVRWWATRGGGAHERTGRATTRLQVSEVAEIDRARMAVHPAAAAARLPSGTAPVPRSPLPLVELVRGEIDAFFVDCCHVWDHAPWILLVREAGGAFTDQAGTGSGECRGGLYSNGHVHADLLGALRPPIVPLGWLAAPPDDEVGAAVAGVTPHLAGRSVDVRLQETGGAAPWRRATAAVGDHHVVKFAWSMAAAARKLRHEARVTQALSSADPPLALVAVEAVADDPVIMVTRRSPGAPVWYPEVAAMPADARRSFAAELGRFLHRLHEPSTLALVEAAAGPLASPVPQATTQAIRARLAPFIDDRQRATVAGWCDWVDEAQAQPAPRVLLHGDFSGHNLLWDHAEHRLVAVVDFEEAAAGDPNYDFRYLPSHDATFTLLDDVAGAYADAGGDGYDLRRVMAWSVRTVLGDILWRGEAGVALPFGGGAEAWLDDMARRLDRSAVMERTGPVRW